MHSQLNTFLHLLCVVLLSLMGHTSIAQKTAKTSPAFKKFTKECVGDKAFSFFVMGDFGKNGEGSQQKVADAMKKCAEMIKPKFVVTTGDNFYCCGVASKDDPQWMNSFENVYKGDALQIDWFGVLGNHDYMGSVQAEIDYSKKSRKWVMPSRYYTSEQKIDGVQKARFVFTDTNPFVKAYRNQNGKFSDVDVQDTVREIQWMDSVLAASSKDSWKFVFGHHPLYASKKGRDVPELQRNYKPLFEKYGVQVYFSGHVHNLEHLKPAGSSVDYFISGAGAEVSDPGEPNVNSLFVKGAPGFLVASIKGPALHVFLVDSDLNILYDYVITHSK
jgi:tartrate-resistant acid phosphatase type 5